MEIIIMGLVLGWVFGLGYFAADRLDRGMTEEERIKRPFAGRNRRWSVFTGANSPEEIAGAITRARERFGRSAVTVFMAWDPQKIRMDAEKEQSARAKKA